VIDERPMSDSTSPAPSQSLSPRAGVAVLTLQLRNILQEAMAAEAEVAALDVDAEVWQLRARLGPLIEDRKQALAQELLAEEQRADAAVDAARDEAADIVRTAHERVAEDEARRAADEVRRRTMLAAEAARAASAAAAAAAVDAEPAPVPPTLLFDDPLIEEQLEIMTPAGPLPPPVSSIVPPPPAPLVLAAPEIIDATSVQLLPPEADGLLDPEQVDVAGDLLGDDSTMWAEHPPVPASTIRLPVTAIESAVSSSEQAKPLHVVIDAESFAAAFAAAMAPVLATLEQGSPQSQYPPQGWVPVQAPPAKKSFWAHAWHPDVLLSGLAMVIVIIVLIAWTG
jgi:hypothetical protein